MITVPYHLDERLPDVALGLPVEREVVAALPDGGPWERMAALYEQVAEAVRASPSVPVVLSGDCTTSLGVLAGLQRAGRDPGVVWFDAHADFNTPDTTTTGFTDGMGLAIAVGHCWKAWSKACPASTHWPKRTWCWRASGTWAPPKATGSPTRMSPS